MFRVQLQDESEFTVRRLEYPVPQINRPVCGIVLNRRNLIAGFCLVDR